MSPLVSLLFWVVLETNRFRDLSFTNRIVGTRPPYPLSIWTNLAIHFGTRVAASGNRARWALRKTVRMKLDRFPGQGQNSTKSLLPSIAHHLTASDRNQVECTVQTV